jgi:hypothetical protein
MTEHPPHILGVKVRRRPILMPAPSSNTQDGHFDGEQDDDLEAECGRWDQNARGGLSPYYRLAGTEWCDWDHPLNKWDVR